MASPLLRQIWTMSAVLLNMFGQGMVLSYPASLLPGLNRPDSPVKIDLHIASWLGSMVGVAGIPGFLTSSFLMAQYGRRLTHGLVIIPAVVGWLLIYFAKNITMLMIGRFLCGFTSNATVSLGAIVMGEYTTPKYRGVFLYLKNASVCMGAMSTHIISHFLHWRTIALVSEIPLLIALVITYTWPESPWWLASKHLYEKSRESFYWLRGRSEASQREINDTLTAQRANQAKPELNTSYFDEIKLFFRKFTMKDFLKPFTVMLLATTVLEMSGRHIFPAYALRIINDITGEASQSFYYTLGTDILITTSAVVASIIVTIMNRRTLLFSSGFSAMVVLMAVCSYLFLVSKDIISNDKSWIPLSLLLLYFILANLGCAPVPIALVGEVFPLAHRGVGAALSGIWISILLWVGLESTPYLLVHIGVYGFFAVYGSIMAAALLILYFIMPETKDRTLLEIENYFNHGKFTNDMPGDEEAHAKMVT